MEGLAAFESMVLRKFQKRLSHCRRAVKIEVEEYLASGDEKDIKFILLNLNRIVKARGYKDFESANLSKAQIDSAIKGDHDDYWLIGNKELNNDDRAVINKMLGALGIEERI